MKILATILTILISSCSCNWHLNKLEKKCGKFTTDTLTVIDTLITKEVKTDTVFKYYQKDTVIVREGKLTMKYFYNNHDSTVYLNGKCAPDTIIREIRVPYEKAEVTVDYFPKWLIILVAIIAVVFLIRNMVKK